MQQVLSNIIAVGSSVLIAALAITDRFGTGLTDPPRPYPLLEDPNVRKLVREGKYPVLPSLKQRQHMSSCGMLIPHRLPGYDD